VLDLGCGTGTLALAIAAKEPCVVVTGGDGDRKVLDIARQKLARAGKQIVLVYGDAKALVDFADGSFDRVVSSLVFHHLDRQAKQRALEEAFRVLAPAGQVHIADWGKPHGAVMRTLFLGRAIARGVRHHPRQRARRVTDADDQSRLRGGRRDSTDADPAQEPVALSRPPLRCIRVAG
jgi:ubiquinone/menaquinone biosynthesis C-methylase UbiE